MPPWIARTRAASVCPGLTGRGCPATASASAAATAAVRAADGVGAVGAGVAEDIPVSVVARGAGLKRPAGQVAHTGCR